MKNFRTAIAILFSAAVVVGGSNWIGSTLRAQDSLKTEKAELPRQSSAGVERMEVTRSSEDVSLTAQLVKAEQTGPALTKYLPNELIKVKLTLENKGKKPVVSVGVGMKEDYLIVGKAGDGSPVPQLMYGKSRGVESINGGFSFGIDGLEPGQKVEEVLVLNRFIDLSLTGTYTVSIGKRFSAAPKLVSAVPVTFDIEDLPTH